MNSLGSSEQGPLLRAEKICKTFTKGKKEIPVVRNVDLTINPGELVAITGASGVRSLPGNRQSEGENPWLTPTQPQPKESRRGHSPAVWTQ